MAEKKLTQSLRIIGKTQKELADYLGVSERTVSNWALGNHKISARYVQRMYEFGLDTETILNPNEDV